MKPLFGALRSGHWPSLFGAWLHFEVSFMVWLLVGALGVLIAEDFKLSPSEKGLLVAIPLLGGAILRIVVGICTDKFGAKQTGMVLLLGECLALLWGWLGATSFVQVLGVGLLLGVAGASFAVSLPLASRAYPSGHQGLAMGVAASGNSGVVVVAFLAPRIGEVVGWHAVFGLMVIPVALTTLIFWLMVKGNGNSHVPREGLWAMMVEGIRNPAMSWLCLLYAVTFGGFVGLLSYLPIFFHDQYGLNPVTAGSLTAMCGLAGSVIRPLGGYVADRKGGLGILWALFLVIVVFSIIMAQLPSLVIATGVVMGMVTTMGFGNGVVFQVVAERFPAQIGMASGLVGAAGGVGGFMLPSFLGILKEVTGTYRPGFFLFAAVALFAWAIVMWACKRQGMTANSLG